MERYELLKYFLECYFNVSANYDELEQLITEFRNSETAKNQSLLIAELETIQRLDNWEFIHEFVRKYGMRNMAFNKLKWFIDTLQLNMTK
ncbi:contact-dependent growth inhibition system immunity protein [Paenibacillus sp. L3-i20]|uniref:contact-dependent growth inhibition system immunity protein n=1 Tax=Paenibacillus sp. L3-i20 TaxID=2905833 RepID=UPI001EE07901|nr:contact-dependent growth inhibition system immunity protein [Paenibacillus sp. L3-i20]GKU76498.1 hypothetical protein L3i20_v208950 [Paenibacillus sp. L3-i20]